MILKRSTTENTTVSIPPQVAEIAVLRLENAALQQESAELKRQLAWFKNHMFGSKSENALPAT